LVQAESSPKDYQDFTGHVESILYFNPREAVQFEVVVKGEGGFEKKVRLKWLGQRNISGINLGSKLHVQGSLVSTQDSNLPTIFNPKYDLISA
jgi:hypothetical protein